MLAGGGNIIFCGGTLQYSSSNNQDYSGRITGSTGPISIDTGFANVAFASGLASSNTGGLTELGFGTLVLLASNGYTGPTILSGNTLRLANSAALPFGGAITFRGGTLQFSSSNSQDYSGSIVGSTGAISIDTNGTNVTFANDSSNSSLWRFDQNRQWFVELNNRQFFQRKYACARRHVGTR